jgi:hypothetical protein
MPFVHAVCILPLRLLGIGVIKEIDQVLIHLGLILFDDGQVIPPIAMYTGAPLLLRVHGVGADDASFDYCRVDQRGSSTDLIFFAVNRSLGQDNPL